MKLEVPTKIKILKACDFEQPGRNGGVDTIIRKIEKI